jgi:ATP-dependent DNA ligase
MSKEQMTRSMTEITVEYKKNVSSAFIAITADQIGEKLAGSSFFVTRKYDGMLALLFWDGKKIAALNSSGAAIDALPCFTEAEDAFKAAKIAEAAIAAELYAEESGGRSRVFDAVKALADKQGRDNLCLAVFDIISLNGKPFKAAHWGETFEKLTAIFGKGKSVLPVKTEKAAGKNEVSKLFETWVTAGGAEGIVVRSELPLVYKIKPKYSIDAVVVGFSLGQSASVSGTPGGAANDEVRTLLLALMDEDGSYQIIGRCGAGIPAEERKPLADRLSKTRVPSSYIETDSNHVAFCMVRPELVVEISATDAIFENSSGPVINQRLTIDKNGCRRTGQVPGFSMVYPVFERFRDDKKAKPQDARLSQISELFYTPYGAAGKEREELPKSKLLKREVYKKESGGKLMALKFLLWKTNKEAHGWPAYAAACVNYSSARADPLTQDLRISGDREQIEQLYAAFVESNVKKGWEKV